ncbi:DUF3854 domain-containing protein [Picosynechococcus sp. PCC 8807]|uniref:DUF3854 domain-containing protein n=1 Tax=Picosynechococcus sp. PCC 8807 TaxID=195248 RepID=UPI0008107FF6|nr:DUF3854 domain-containing protein [Picosynechococcus sp. PCC 8807]ANV90778.1 hypothetical protein AWQ24_09115 [Picosynechococcus sp. PCC 8807]
MQTLQKTALETELEASAIAPDLAALNFTNIMGGTAWEYLFYTDSQALRTNTGTLRKKWLKTYAHIDNGGWWCGTLDILNSGRSPWGCFKAKTPRTDSEGKPIKYEHPPTVPTEPFFLEIARDRWERIANMHGLGFPDLSDMPPSADPFEFWEWVKNNPQLPIIITEGAKKTASLLSASYCAVGLSGIWNGAPKELAGDGTPLEKKLKPQLQAIATEGREIIFCFDNDAKPKTIAAVTKATETLAALFEAEGCKTSVMYWHGVYEEKGIDDVHAVHGRDALDKLFGDRLPLDRWLDLMRKPILTDPTKAPKVEAKVSTPLQPVSTYDPALEPEDPDDGEKELPPALTYQEIALQTVFSEGHYVAINDELYKFNGTHYEKLTPQTEKLKIKAWAEQYWVKDPKTKRKTLKYLTPRSINAIWDWALLSFGINPDRINPPGLNLANGVLRIKWNGREPQWRLYPHTPKDIYLYCSKVKFDPDADPTQCNKLLECLDPAPRTALLRQLAAAFDLDTVRKLHSRGIKAAIAKGTGANGKDSIRAAISKIFCNQMTSLGLSEFQTYDQGRKFGLAPLENSLVNWSSENNMGTTLDRVESLNICVTGEENGIWIERKNKDGYAITPRAVHIFNTNQIPKLKSGMDSLLSRFVVLDFNKTFKQNPDRRRGELPADPRFHDDPQFLITEVCPALINRLLEELGNLAKFGIDYDALASGLEDLQEESTHLWGFVQDTGLELNPDGKVWVHDLWDRLKDWYQETGTLEVEEMDNGKTRNIWHEQANQYDRNVTGANQIYKRFKLLFPKIKRVRETSDPVFKGRYFLSGLSFNQDGSLLHNPDNSGVSASPDGSPCFTNTLSASLSPSEAKNEAGREAEKQTVQGGEAAKQSSDKSPEKSDTENFSVGDRVIDTRTGEELTILEEPGIGSRAIRQEYSCQRANTWMAIAKLTRQGGEKHNPIEVGCVAKSQDGELVDVKAISEDGLWAWCERNEILVPKHYLQLKA